MYSGARKVKPDHRDYDFHKSFGSANFDVSLLPLNYSADANLTMPDQMADNLPYGCTGYTQSELCTDEDGVVYDPFDTYISTKPYDVTEGRDIRDSLQVLIDRGPKTKDGKFGPKRTNFYTIKKMGVLDNFDALRVAMFITKEEHRSASVGLPWQKEFENTGADGILPMVTKPTWDNGTGHNAKVAGWTTTNTKGQLIRNGELFLMVKSWQGQKFGDNGWCYASRPLTNAIFNVQYTGAFTVTKLTPPNGIQTNDLNIIAFLISCLRAFINKLMPKSNGITPTIYAVAKSSIGRRITLNSFVPPDVGCAEAVSYILKQAGYVIPAKGIEGTQELYQWLQQNFQQVCSPQAGDIVISPTGMSSKYIPHGHTGVVMQHGICSNDSSTGLFQENYTLDSWKAYFGDKCGFPIFYYRSKDIIVQ